MAHSYVPLKKQLTALVLVGLGCVGDIASEPRPPGGGAMPAALATAIPAAMPTMSPPTEMAPGASTKPAAGPALPISAATCTPGPGLAPLRRLNRFAYDNMVRDLLGDETRPAQALPPEDSSGAFSNQAEVLGTSPLLVQGYVDITADIASRAVKSRLAKLVPCVPAVGDEACARKFVETFGRRAWRHPLPPGDVDELMAVYRVGAAEGDSFAAGIQATIEALLQAPDFLYLAEVGTPGPNGTRRLTSWEVAARLAYTLWATTPDDALLAVAEANQLTEKTQIATAARRLLADKRARPLIQRFAEEWLGITNVTRVGKDAKVFPMWKGTQPYLFREETRLFFDDLVFADKRPSALTMFTGRDSFMNAELAALYGGTGVTGAAFVRTPLPDKRGGMLTQMSLLATYAKSNQTDPIHRGKFVRLNLLCGELPSAPSDVEIKVPELSAKLTTRERFSQHASDPVLCRLPPADGSHRSDLRKL